MATLFLCGDVMLGRGVDQILPHPGDAALQETSVKTARTYVELAESANGPVLTPVGYDWPWGDALSVLDDLGPDARVINLETSITRSDDFAPGKAVHYRMSPDNVPCLAAARPDACALANNHVLDFGRRGLAETLDVLERAGIPAVGAGRDAAEARRPAIIEAGDGVRVLVFSIGMESSGVPPEWAATDERAGVDFAPGPSDVAAAGLARRAREVRRPGDIVVVSIHWGSNWGYHVSRDQVRFAHALVDDGVDVVHGHSSHHPRPIEIYRDRPILYGCGDFVDDYEGIAGHEEFRDDLRVMYFVSLEPGSGRLTGLRMVPMRARRLRLGRAPERDARWLAATLDRVSRGFGTRVERSGDGSLYAVGRSPSPGR